MIATSPRIESIQVGRAEQHGDFRSRDPMQGLWTSAIVKSAIAGPACVGPTGVEGDSQADLEVHGGPDKAVCAYAALHYPFWRVELGLADMPPGAFGENFTLADLSEADVCIGDAWRAGESLVLQVSQPRQPCWKLARRWQIKTLAAQVQQSGKTGWYFRVLQAGPVAAGGALTLLERPNPQWTVAEANRVMYHDRHNLEAAAALAAAPELSESWRASMEQRLRNGRWGGGSGAQGRS
ncbi:MAG TPA: MOSC domain-containing protein [Lacipirellulaceae bacterium]|nr:MOSC domain-containing protein [Lacipirellulaceae bacterium]